ncbi:hypothetical protein [Antarctobacter jejuensis]|uniref:hypothetical protein n=1 Tax=Antarctobacter jejuensis TaxID=1439938 RepID=UPI003FD681A4
MGTVLRLTLLCYSLLLAQAAQAEREVHVLAVGHGQPSQDLYALPEAHVLVDRPGREVGLVLLDGGTLRWHVEATDGTHVTEIIRSGPGPEDSEVLFSGIPMVGVQVQDLPLVFRPRGRDFRLLVDLLADRMGTQRIDSFQGRNQFHGRSFTVDRVDTQTPGLAQDYLAHSLGVTEDLPAALRTWLESDRTEGAHTVDFDETGLTLNGPNGTRSFPVPPDVPPVLLPVAAVYAPGEEMIYGLTYGGEGYLYAVDVQTGDWEVVASLREYDAAGLLYVADERLLILTGAFSRPGDIRGVWLDGRRFASFTPTIAFPGLSDLFDYGNEHGPPLIPQAYADGWLLVEALGEGFGTVPDSGPDRIYAVRTDTGEVRLLSYRNN